VSGEILICELEKGEILINTVGAEKIYSCSSLQVNISPLTHRNLSSLGIGEVSTSTHKTTL